MDCFNLSPAGNLIRIRPGYYELTINEAIVSFDSIDLPFVESTKWIKGVGENRLLSSTDHHCHLDDLIFEAKGIFAPYSMTSLFDRSPRRKFMDNNPFNLRRSNLWLTNARRVKDEYTHISVLLKGKKRFLLDYEDFDLALMTVSKKGKDNIKINGKPLCEIISTRMGFHSSSLNYYNCNSLDNRRANLRPCQQMIVSKTSSYYIVIVKGFHRPIYVDAEDIDIARLYTWLSPTEKQSQIHNEFGDNLCDLIIERFMGFKALMYHTSGNVFDNRRDNFGLQIEMFE